MPFHVCSFPLLFALKGKPLGGSVGTQLPGKLFTDFEAWSPHNSQVRGPETQGPKYCHSSFDTITVGKMDPPVPGFFLPFSLLSLPPSPVVPRARLQVDGRVTESRTPMLHAFCSVASSHQAWSGCLLPPCPTCARHTSASWLGNLGSRISLSWKEGSRLTVILQVSLVSEQTGNSDYTSFKAATFGRWPLMAMSQSPSCCRRGGQGCPPTLRLLQ